VFEFILVRREIFVVWFEGCLAVETKHGQFQISFLHGSEKVFMLAACHMLAIYN